MSNNPEHTVPVGSRVLPGIDLTLWTYLIIGLTLAVVLITGAIALIAH